jgi:hypothetical protein
LKRGKIGRGKRKDLEVNRNFEAVKALDEKIGPNGLLVVLGELLRAVAIDDGGLANPGKWGTFLKKKKRKRKEEKEGSKAKQSKERKGRG